MRIPGLVALYVTEAFVEHSYIHLLSLRDVFCGAHVELLGQLVEAVVPPGEPT